LRPNFVAIADDFVRRCLGISASESTGKSDRVATLMAVQRGIRGLAKANKDSLDELFNYANSLPPVRPTRGCFAGQSIPVRLSKVRILEKLLWADVAIHDEKHQDWSRWYSEAVASGMIQANSFNAPERS
jgi:hypothetical protein